MKSTPDKDIEEANNLVNKLAEEIGYDKKTVITIDSPLLVDDDNLLLFHYHLNELAPKQLFDKNTYDILIPFMSKQVANDIKRLANDIVHHELRKLTDDQFTNSVVYAGVIRSGEDVIVSIQTLVI